MKPPRITLASIMWVVLIASLDFAGARALQGSPSVFVVILVLASLPMASLLLLGLPALARGWWGESARRPFLLGFEGVGWTTVALCAGVVCSSPDLLDRYLEVVLRVLGLTNIPYPPAMLLLAALLLLPPQLLVALAGGWFFGRFKVRLVIERRERRHPGSHAA